VHPELQNSGSARYREDAVIGAHHHTHGLPITRQAEVLNISRGIVYYLPRPVSESDLAIMRQLDRLHLEYPLAGSRMLRGLFD